MSVVDVCTPTKTHAELCIKALARGHHVICEKPLSRTIEEAESIVRAASESNGIFMPAMCLRFWPEWAWLKKAIDGGRYGKLQALHLRRIAEAPAWGHKNYFSGKESGGALFDLHVHDLDFIQYCCGRPSRVYSSGFSKVSGAIDHVLTQYTVASGACVSAEGSWAMTSGFGFNMAYTAVFEEATVDYDLSRTEEALRLYRGGEKCEVVECAGLDGYAAELDYFLSCVRAGQEPTVVTAEDALFATKLCCAEEESVRTGECVSL